MMIKDITYESPGFFYLFLLFIPMIAWYLWKEGKSNATIQVSSVQRFKYFNRSIKYYLRHGIFVLRLITISFIIVALARPQSTNEWQDVTTEGIDIVMSLDISGSMLAQDFRPNRLEAAKDVAIQFITGRPDDRIGLVVFSGESFTQCPLTLDHAVLINLFKDVKSGMIEDGTAIGMGLANAVNRLKESKAISKVVILLTDGVNNTGSVAPLTAAEIAETYDIRVYTIGVGTRGMAPYPVQTPFGTQYQNMEVKIDEDVLQEIASQTGGEYFRATDNQKLAAIYEQIDKLEKSKIDVKEYSKKQEEYFWFVALAAFLFLIEIVLRYTVFRSIP